MVGVTALSSARGQPQHDVSSRTEAKVEEHSSEASLFHLQATSKQMSHQNYGQ